MSSSPPDEGLSDLPPEILRMIAEFLPIRDQIAMSNTNRMLHDAVGVPGYHEWIQTAISLLRTPPDNPRVIMEQICASVRLSANVHRRGSLSETYRFKLSDTIRARVLELWVVLKETNWTA